MKNDMRSSKNLHGVQTTGRLMNNLAFCVESTTSWHQGCECLPWLMAKEKSPSYTAKNLITCKTSSLEYKPLISTKYLLPPGLSQAEIQT